MEIDIKENKEIVLEILPNNAKTENLELCSSNSQIAILEKSDVEDTKDEITLKIKPIAEKNCKIYVKSTNKKTQSTINASFQTKSSGLTPCKKCAK